MGMIGIVLGIMIGILLGVFLTVYAIQNMFKTNAIAFNEMISGNPFLSPAETVGTIFHSIFPGSSQPVGNYSRG